MEGRYNSLSVLIFVRSNFRDLVFTEQFFNESVTLVRPALVTDSKNGEAEAKRLNCERMFARDDRQ